jgi:stage II sporulation protein D
MIAKIVPRIALCLSAVLPLTATLEAGFFKNFNEPATKNQPVPAPKIKVLVTHDQPSVNVQVIGKYKIFDPHAKAHISTRFVGKTQAFQAIPEGLKWGEEFPGIHQLEIIPAGPETVFFVNGVQYRGNLYIYNIGGTVSVVDELPLEDYLATYLPIQATEPLSEETLASLVIAARTNAYFQVQNPKSSFWTVDGSQIGYRGVTGIDPNTPLQRAIRNTRYMVLSRPGGKSENGIDAFSLQWEKPSKNKPIAMNPKPEISKISLVEAEALAKKGEHAASILEKAFPRTSIQMIQVDEN